MLLEETPFMIKKITLALFLLSNYLHGFAQGTVIKYLAGVDNNSKVLGVFPVPVERVASGLKSQFVQIGNCGILVSVVATMQK